MFETANDIVEADITFTTTAFCYRTNIANIGNEKSKAKTFFGLTDHTKNVALDHYMEKAKDTATYQLVVEYLEMHGAIYDPPVKLRQLLASRSVMFGRKGNSVSTLNLDKGERITKTYMI